MISLPTEWVIGVDSIAGPLGGRRVPKTLMHVIVYSGLWVTQIHEIFVAAECCGLEIIFRERESAGAIENRAHCNVFDLVFVNKVFSDDNNFYGNIKRRGTKSQIIGS